MSSTDNFNNKPRFTSCMDQNISTTLREIANLKIPVVRSCHIGNNTSNNWGFLVLAKNAQLVQYDHTTYGVDENCAPWLVLNDNGLIDMCYDHKGNLNTQDIGKHINIHMRNNSKKYAQRLNYSIFCQFNEKDLINYHYNIANKLSNILNGHNASFDAKEILSIKEILRDIFKTFHIKKKLHFLFNRWVKKSKKNDVIMYKIGEIYYGPYNTIKIFTNEKIKVFSGSIDNLCNNFFDSMQNIHDRIINVKSLEVIDYPWLNIKFSYLISSIKEFFYDKKQKTFWHAGGSASSYYINNIDFSDDINNLIDHMVNYQYLPSKARINLIPSFCCQLFATNKNSLLILEKLIETWVAYKNRNPKYMEGVVNLLSKANSPLEIVKKSFQETPGHVIKSLENLILIFNKIDINKLPIAHISSYNHPFYNKYGIAQYKLIKEKIFFPLNLYDLSWGEAELLVKILAEITINSQG